jgi:hypothetical protein
VRYEVRDAYYGESYRVIWRGDWESCISFMQRVNGCKGPFLEGSR